MESRLIRSIRESKSERLEVGPDDFLAVSIPALQSNFDPETARWNIESGDLKTRESEVYSLYRREQLRQLLLMHMLATKEVNLTNRRQEIAKKLEEHAGALEMQGFQAKELLKNPEVQALLREHE